MRQRLLVGMFAGALAAVVAVVLDDASQAAQDYGFKVCGYGAAAA
jgi:hypothetical protein